MKRSLQRRKEEPLHKWLDRVAEDILFHCSDMDNYRPILRDILREISFVSYISGTNAVNKVSNKHKKFKLLKL